MEDGKTFPTKLFQENNIGKRTKPDGKCKEKISGIKIFIDNL